MEEDDDNESSDSDASDKNVKKSRQLSSVVRVKQVFLDLLKSHYSITVIVYAQLYCFILRMASAPSLFISNSFILELENIRILVSPYNYVT